MRGGSEGYRRFGCLRILGTRYRWARRIISANRIFTRLSLIFQIERIWLLLIENDLKNCKISQFWGHNQVFPSKNSIQVTDLE